MSKKVALLILDGWGLGDGSKSDAIANANLHCSFNSMQLQCE